VYRGGKEESLQDLEKSISRPPLNAQHRKPRVKNSTWSHSVTINETEQRRDYDAGLRGFLVARSLGQDSDAHNELGGNKR